MIELLKQIGEVAVQIWPILIIVGLIVLALVLPNRKIKNK